MKQRSEEKKCKNCRWYYPTSRLARVNRVSKYIGWCNCSCAGAGRDGWSGYPSERFCNCTCFEYAPAEVQMRASILARKDA